MQLPVFTFCLATTPASHQCLPKSSWRTAWTFYSSAVFSPDQSSEEFKLFWLNFKINDVRPLSILRNVTKKHNFSRQGRLKMFPQGCSFREWTPLDIMFQQMFLLSSKQEVLRLEHEQECDNVFTRCHWLRSQWHTVSVGRLVCRRMWTCCYC